MIIIMKNYGLTDHHSAGFRNKFFVEPTEEGTRVHMCIQM